MPPKAKIPAPIDRPLSRAYLREFGGWSTAYPPGVSDPTSLRIMENVLINREGSCRVRPGLAGLMLFGGVNSLPANYKMVGSYETFFLNDGTKAYLFAVRNLSDAGKIRFLVASVRTDGRLEVSDAIDLFNVDEWFDAGLFPEFTAGTTYVRWLQIDNKVLALSNNGEPAILFEVGATKKIRRIVGLEKPINVWDPPLAEGGGGFQHSRLTVGQPQSANILGGAEAARTGDLSAGSKANSLQSSTGTDSHNIAFCFTYSHELGETRPSTVTQANLRRPFGAWLAQAPAAYDTQSAEPSGLPALQVAESADSLIVRLGSSAGNGWDEAVASGATHVNLYMMSWSNTASVPVELQRVGSREINYADPARTSNPALWKRKNSSFLIHPGTVPIGGTLPIPTKDNVFNSSYPPTNGQGLVAADRLVLAYDKAAPARVRWSTNKQGDYLNLDPADGGGYKTLTSGNMQIPAAVKLWQNPQSADTITLLCQGTDGYSTAYYMAPASVSSQSDNTQIMGFEETTATQGTTSPYGCEVANNALFHPLDDQLMKSTASNYNINHKSQSDQIANMWQALDDKVQIVSSFHDQRLYFLVNNPAGEALEEFCNGNEVWVFDLSVDGGNWSRWLTQGVSLRKIEVHGRLMMTLVKPDGIHAFDEQRHLDGSWLNPELGEPIAWRIETNTQGANRAHDAWAHLQQVNVTVGNFVGDMRFGVRGLDMHGKMQRFTARAKSKQDGEPDDGLPYDLDIMLLVQRDLKEWFFFAESIPDTRPDSPPVLPFGGQLSLVQYRYTPVSVNIGYEWGGQETLPLVYEMNWTGSDPGVGPTTVNGVPAPYVDTSRP